jgi:transposase
MPGHVAEFFDLAWDSVKAIDKAHLTEKVGPVDLRGADGLAIDEFAIRRGHRYATVVIDLRTTQVLSIGRGRKREERARHSATTGISSSRSEPPSPESPDEPNIFRV